MHTKSLPPDFRWKAVKAALAKDEPQAFNDVVIERVYKVMKEERPDPTVWFAVSLIEQEYYQGCMLAFFLSKATPKLISDTMWIPLDVVHLFGKLFIDFEQFLHKMDYRFYAERCVSTALDDRIKNLMAMALTTGPISQQYYWSDPDKRVEIKPKEMSTHLATMAYFKAISANNMSLNSVEAKEAMKWSAMTKAQLQATEDFDDGDRGTVNAFDAIDEFDHTKTIEAAGIPDLGQIMH